MIICYKVGFSFGVFTVQWWYESNTFLYVKLDSSEITPKYLHCRQFSFLFQKNWSVLLKWCCRELYFNIYGISYGSIISRTNRESLLTSALFSAWQLAVRTGVWKGRLCHIGSEPTWKSDPRGSSAGFQHPKMPLALLWKKSWNTLQYKLNFKASVGKGERKVRPQHFRAEWTQRY